MAVKDQDGFAVSALLGTELPADNAMRGVGLGEAVPGAQKQE